MTFDLDRRRPPMATPGWQPALVLVERDVQDDPNAREILGRCTRARVVVVPRVDGRSDHDLLREVIGEISPMRAARLARDSLLLFGDSEIAQQMAAGSVAERRCFNFTKVTPYAAVCRADCGYCWFKDSVLVPKVNVRFFDHLPDLLARYRTETRGSVVLTFTHYKTDCFAIEHLTGFARRMADVVEQSDGCYVQFLTKLDRVETLLERPPRRGTVVGFSINALHIARLVESGASPVVSRLEAGRQLIAAGIPVVLRIDPVLAIGDWPRGYAELARLIAERFAPEHITVGTPRFQDLEELRRVVDRARQRSARVALELEASRMSANKPGRPAANGMPHYFRNLVVSYAYDLRRTLYQHVIEALGRELPRVPVGLCEEPASMWDACGLVWHGDPTRDCSCNFIPPLTAASGGNELRLEG